MVRFVIAAQGVDDLQDLSMVSYLSGSQFATSLAHRLARSLAEVMVHAQEEMRVDEIYVSREIEMESLEGPWGSHSERKRDDQKATVP